jgi:hypothetical protein
MPRNVRNFWIDLDVDGRKGRVGTGPQAKEGGFDMVIKTRDYGEIRKAVTILGRAKPDGTLTIRIEAAGQEEITITRRR